MNISRWLCAWLLACTLAVWGEPSPRWQQFTSQLEQLGLSLQKELPSTWGGELSRQDLQLLLGVLNALNSWGEASDQPLSREVLSDTRLSLTRYCQRLKVSLSTLPDPSSALSWLAQVEELASRLQAVEKSFGGYHLPSRQQLAQSPLDREWELPTFADPAELAREARSIRLDVQSISGPWNGPAGYGAWGAWGGGGWPAAQQLQDLIQAAYRYETVCNSRYENVVQTRTAFLRLQNAFDRFWPSARSQSFNLRNVERALNRLERFYLAMESPSP